MFAALILASPSKVVPLGEVSCKGLFHTRPVRHHVAVREAQHRVPARAELTVVRKIALAVGGRGVEGETVQLDDQAIADQDIHVVTCDPHLLPDDDAPRRQACDEERFEPRIRLTPCSRR